MKPMLATTADLPTGTGWAYEFKWDGVRAIAVISGELASRSGKHGGGGARFYARSGAEITAAYPELAPLAGELSEAVLDGEVVAFDEAGRPSFTRLAERMHVRDRYRAAQLAARVPITYMIFDVLVLNGVGLADRPYAERRAILDELAASGLSGAHWLVPPMFPDGPATMAAARENELEGVVAKRLNSVYRPGARSPDWIKAKLEPTIDLVVGGWRPGARKLGALLVGTPRPDRRLVFRGRVGGGIGAAAERALLAELESRRAPGSPFAGEIPREDAKDATWVRPELVVEVKYGSITPDGRMRFPRFLRIRLDKTVEECIEEVGGAG
jgi:bifunctional non-homologous end joining protein LigD